MSASRDKRFFACLAMKHANGVGPKTWKLLLKAYGDPFAAVRSADQWTDKGLASGAVAKKFLAEEWRPGAEREYRAARPTGWDVMIWSDEDYPEGLRHIPDPPLVLYLKGNRSLVRYPGLAVVGARKSSGNGMAAARKLCSRLSSFGVTVVSGMAAGIDRQAHLGALEGPGSTVAVMGTGPDRIFPVSNRDLFKAVADQGLVLTEFAPGTIPHPGNFPYRNRIISGLSLGVLVAEAPKRSGALITARLAGEQGRDVFALPGAADDPRYQGCLELIRQGAELVRSADEIVWSLRERLSAQLPDLDARLSDPAVDGQLPEEKPPPPLPEDPDERAVLELFAEAGRLHIDDVARGTGWEAGRVSTILLALELRGLVRKDPGMYYRRA